MQADASSALAPATTAAGGSGWRALGSTALACLVHSLVLVLLLEALGLMRLNHQLRRVSITTEIILFMHRWPHSSAGSPFLRAALH